MTVSGNMSRGGSWLWRQSLSRRLAAAMVLSLTAIQAQAFAQIFLFSKPEFRLTGTRWLAETTQDAVRAALAVPMDKRLDFITQKSRATEVKLSWSLQRPATEPDESQSALVKRLSATLREVLGSDAKTILIAAQVLRYRFPIERVRVTIVPEGLGPNLSAAAVRADEPDVLIPAGVRIAVELKDDSWLTVEPIGFNDLAFGNSLPFAPLVAGGIIIALVSTWTARRMVAPLDRLVSAAERIGTAREPVQVDTAGLHEFAAVARAFEDMQQRLLKFVDDRTQMLAAISHDMRTALTRLRLAVEPFQKDTDQSAVIAEIDDMQSMVESTLAFATGEARLAPNQPTDIAALLISLVDEETDAGRACEYSGPNHIETMAHPVSLKRAFRNIIDNAVKYGTAARVDMVVEDTKLSIQISDDGPGISPERIEEAFTPFRRLDEARSGAIPGAGLGLTIARDVIQSHGGTITLNSLPNEGLTVTMVLPRR
jgi:signal transduction histidine kinase